MLLGFLDQLFDPSFIACVEIFFTRSVCRVPSPSPPYFVCHVSTETQKRERKRRTRAAQERRAAAKDARDEDRRTARIAAMRAFTVDLEVIC